MDLSPKWAFRALIASMLLLSGYWTVDVQVRRMRLFGSTASLEIASGGEVVFGQAIDGDEISVKHGDQTFTVRLLGIKAFDVSNEPGLGDPGQRAIDTLQRYAGKSGRVLFPERNVDGAGRLLAYLEVEGTDVGAELVRDGWALVYTKYPFSEMEAYLALEELAQVEHRGLWSSPKATERALKVQAGWEGEP
ncbi:MAG: thermonuclease family protein [Alphaproteobacteria bacterium]|nr:thermonuclease family protein [Alphaproteobacteria bacterium]